MVDFHSNLVAALETILPTHYELFLHSGLATPCISYMELNNSDEETGDTLGYSSISYQVKVWGNKIEELQHYACAIDAALRPLGFKRTGGTELSDPNSTMIQKILTYEGTALEVY